MVTKLVAVENEEMDKEDIYIINLYICCDYTDTITNSEHRNMEYESKAL